LRNVKPVGPNSDVINDILALLAEWHFRPALRNKTPVEIEVLLVIPSHG
jgi:hypothetical protein